MDVNLQRAAAEIVSSSYMLLANTDYDSAQVNDRVPHHLKITASFVAQPALLSQLQP